MVELIRCKQQLSSLYANQPSLQYRFSDFTAQARGENKLTCLDKFGSVQAIQKYLLEPGSFEHGVANNNTNGSNTVNNDDKVDTALVETGTDSSNTQEVVFSSIDIFSPELLIEAKVYLGYAFWLLIIGIGIITFWKLSEYLFALFYDVMNAGRVQYFKVILPRGDSKSDRERAKELAKDMKEKIGRMSQVYSNLHKLGELSVIDNILRKVFNKPKVIFMLHYEDGLLHFVVGTYPEYRNIVESAIAAQYSESSLETVSKPKLFTKQYTDIMPLQPVKESVYPIRTFKQTEDDPMNNIIDAIAKISSEDTFTVVMTIKPERGGFNKRARKIAQALYKKDDSVLKKGNILSKLLPWNFFKFLIQGPSQEMLERFSGDDKRGDPMIRMVKSEEDALNIMAEEAGKKAYNSGLLLVSGSDNEDRVNENIYNLVSAYTVFSDEYNNSLDQPETVADLFGWMIKPVRKASISFLLPGLLYKDNIFTVNELSSLFHFPDGAYNRAPIIKWMDYKTLAAPDNLPQLKVENEGFQITGIIADSYKKGVVSDIVKTMKHESIGIKEEMIETEVELPDKYVLKEGEEIVEHDGKMFRIDKKTKKLPALKTYKDGVLLGLNVYRNIYSPVYMMEKDRTRHHYIIGKSGTGKSVYINMLARQDIRAGAGVCVIDPHGDLVEDILQYIPKHRAKDVIYFDAGNEERPMGLNLYEIDNFSEADRAVNDSVEIFIKMFGPEIFGPRIQEYFKYGSLTLLEDIEDGATLIDVPRLFTDEQYRNYKTAKVKNPVIRNFWDKTYNAMGDREKQEIIPYFTSKFVSFITNSLIRNIIGQTKSAFDFRDVMDNQKILLINLSKGKIGELNAKLLGMILVSKIYNAAMSRADMVEADRKPFYLYVDEFQNFVTDTFADILSEARKYKLCLIMAHQFIAQLDSNAGSNIGEGKSKVKDAVFGNVGTMQSFKVGAPDAEFLEKEYAPILSAQDILGISNYKAYIKLNINNSTSRVFSLNSIWTNDYKSLRTAEILKKYSEKKYGRKKEFVDAEIAARLGMTATKPPENVVKPTDQESNGHKDGEKDGENKTK